MNIHPAQILWQIREAQPNPLSWTDLCLKLGWPNVPQHTGASMVRDHIQDLLDAGLITSTTVAGDEVYTISPSTPAILKTLGIQLSTRKDIDPKEAMLVKPFFGLPRRLPGVTPEPIFVAMPFGPLDYVYTGAMTAAAKDVGFGITRLDAPSTANNIPDELWSLIANSQVVIADCTGRNPNVFYEVGIAHTLGKTVLLIAQNRSEMPFDVGSIRNYEYDPTPPGQDALREWLKKTLVNYLV